MTTIVCIFTIFYVCSAIWDMKELKELMEDDYDWFFVIMALIPIKNFFQAMDVRKRNQRHRQLNIMRKYLRK